jgi:hypothetical protein
LLKATRIGRLFIPLVFGVNIHFFLSLIQQWHYAIVIPA